MCVSSPLPSAVFSGARLVRESQHGLPLGKHYPPCVRHPHHQGPVGYWVILNLPTGCWVDSCFCPPLALGAALRYSQLFQKNLVLFVSSATFHFLIQLCDQLVLKLKKTISQEDVRPLRRVHGGQWPVCLDLAQSLSNCKLFPKDMENYL